MQEEEKEHEQEKEHYEEADLLIMPSSENIEKTAAVEEERGMVRGEKENEAKEGWISLGVKG